MKRNSTTITITSGKGGVGKSIVAVNLAETLLAENYRVALIQMLILARVLVRFSLNQCPEATVLDLVRYTASVDQVCHQTPSGLTLIQSVAEAGEADGKEKRLYARLDALLQELRPQYDYILIDTPAGVDGPVRWALDRADMGVLVVVGEPTAVADAYRLAKWVWQQDVTYPLGVVVNFEDSETDAKRVSKRFNAVTERFTGQETMYLGWVPFSVSVRQSVSAQRPAVYDPGPVCTAFQALVHTLVEGRNPQAQDQATLSEISPFVL